MFRAIKNISQIALLAMLSLGWIISAQAAPFLSPAGGNISTSGQTFTFFPNDVVVHDFRIDIGTDPAGTGKSNLSRANNLPGSGGAYTAPALPEGLVYVSLIYRTSQSDSYKRVRYEFDAVTVGGSHAENIVSELGCGVNEVLKTNSIGLECVPIAELVSVASPTFSICAREPGVWSTIRDSPNSVCSVACANSSVIAAKIISVGTRNGASSAPATNARCTVESEIGDGCVAYLTSNTAGPQRGSCCVCR